MSDSPVSPAASLSVPNKLNAQLVKQQELCLLASATQEDVSPSMTSSSSATGAADPSAELILRLGWKLRVHAYLAKFVAACGALSLALNIVGFVSSMPPTPLDPSTRIGGLTAGLRQSHSAEWVGAVMLSAGLANLWVPRGRISLLLAFAASLVALVFAGTGLCISLVLLALYFSQCNARASTELLNACLLAVFVMLAQLSGFTALVAHATAYHPYRVFAKVNRRLLKRCGDSVAKATTKSDDTAEEMSNFEFQLSPR